MSADEAKTEDKFAGKNSISETPEEIKNVRKSLQAGGFQDIMLDEMAKHCPGMSYDKLMQAAMSLQKSRALSMIEGSLDSDYNELGRQFKQNIGQKNASTKIQIQEYVRQYHLSGRLNFSWYYQQPITAWEKDFHYIQQLSEFLLSHGELDRANLQERSYEIFQDEKVLDDNPELLEHLGLSLEKLHVVNQPDPLMLAIQQVKKPVGAPYTHFAAATKAVYYSLYNGLNKTRFSTVIYGAGWKLLGNLFQLPYQISAQWYKHEIWYFGNFDYDGIRLWHELKKNKPLGIELKLAVPFYKALLMYPPVKGDVHPERDMEVVNTFCQEFEPELAKMWQDMLSKGRYYPQGILGTQELQKLFKELDKNINHH